MVTHTVFDSMQQGCANCLSNKRPTRIKGWVDSIGVDSTGDAALSWHQYNASDCTLPYSGLDLELCLAIEQESCKLVRINTMRDSPIIVKCCSHMVQNFFSLKQWKSVGMYEIYLFAENPCGQSANACRSGGECRVSPLDQNGGSTCVYCQDGQSPAHRSPRWAASEGSTDRPLFWLTV